MNKSGIALSLVALVLALAVSLFTLKVGGVIARIVYLAMRSRIKLGKGERASKSSTVENGLHVLDTRDPCAPTLLGKVNFVGMVEGVHIADGMVYVANACRGVRSIDVGDPEHPVLIDTFGQGTTAATAATR